MNKIQTIKSLRKRLNIFSKNQMKTMEVFFRNSKINIFIFKYFIGTISLKEFKKAIKIKKKSKIPI